MSKASRINSSVLEDEESETNLHKLKMILQWCDSPQEVQIL